MWRLTSLALLTLLLSASAFGQTSTTVSGTITDTPDGQAWFGGTYSFVFRVSPSNPTGQYFWSGIPFSTSQTIAGALDGSGHYSVSVPSNTSIAPAGSTWDLTVCPLATSVCFTVNSIPITGPTQTVAPIPPSIRINMGSPPPNTRAYTDAEMVAGALGQTYYNIVDATPHYCATFPCGWQVLKGLINVTVAPTGACTPGSPPEQVISTGVIYTCQGGTWAAVASSAAAASPVNVFQKNIGGVLGASNCLELGSVLNCLDDPHFRGPNLGVDVTVSPFNARAVNPNAVPAPTATISSGTNTAVVSANTGLQIGDGFAIVGAGASQSMTTPIAPTVTPSCASGLTGLGYTVPAGAGATAYQYQLAMRDTGQGLTAAGTAGTTSTGNATLGANSTAWTSSASGASNVFTATVGSTANLAAGCMVLLKGSTDDAEFGGWKIVLSVTDGTHFTYQSGIDASRGISTTTATGGTVSFWLCNHVVLPTPGAGGIQYLIYGRTSGSNVYLGNSLIANLGYTDAAYLTWDDYGSPMMDNVARSWWVPNTPPASPVNDTLVTTITNIVGTTLTLADNASTSVTTSQARFDNSPNITAALTAANNTSTTGAGGTIRFPVVVENSGTGSYCYVISTYTVITAKAVIQDGTVCLDDTLQLSGNWYGTDLSAARGIQPTFAFRAHIPIFVFRANPGIYLKSGGINKVDLSISSNGAVGVFNAGSQVGQIFEDDTFTSSLLTTNDYMSIAFYDYQNAGGQGGFGGKFRNCTFTSGGTTNGYGTTATPIWASKYSLEWDFDYISGSLRGFAFIPFSGGLYGKFHMGEEMQGPIMPILNFLPTNVGNTNGEFLIDTVSNDTGAVPLMAYLPTSTASLSADFVIEGGNLPSSAEPLISGSQLAGSILILGLTTGTQTGQNVNVTNFSKTSNSSPGLNTGGLRTPGINVAAVSYSANHTIGVNEGAVNATATLTFTLQHAIRGQIVQVFSNAGTTTLSIDSGTLHGNQATGNIVIPNNTGVTTYCDGTDCYAFGLGGGGGGGSPGGTTAALQYNGGGSSFGGVNSPTVNGNYVVNYNVVASAAVPPTINLPGVPVNAQSGTTYTIGQANTQNDRATLITATNGSAQTYTAVNPSATGFGFNMFYNIWNRGAGAVTENSSGFNLNAGTSLLIPPNWVAPHFSDGVNYFIYRVPSFEAFPNCATAITFTAATGIFGCGSAGAVSAISGDTGLFCNVSSTGAVTLVPCATTLAHKFWGNNTGSTGTAAFFSIGKADLPATTVFTDQANTYGAFNQDFSATTIKMPTAAGFTSSATSTCGYDSTAKITHCYTNNADADVAATTSTSTTVTQVLHATAIAGIYSPSAIVLADLPAPSFPLTVAGTVTSGGIPCFTSTTQESSSALMTVNVYMKGGGAGVCPSPGLTTDDGTTSTYTGTGGTKSPAFTSTGTTSGFMDYPQGTTSSAVAPCNTATSICEQAPTSVTSYLITKPGAAPVNNNSAALTSTAGVQSFAKMPQTAFLTSNYTNATTTFSNVTNLSFSVEANTNYKLTCDLDYQTSATTADVKIQWTGPASPTAVTYDLSTEVTASTLSASVATAFSTALSEAGTPTITTNFPMRTTLTLINGANAGTVQLQAAATGTGTITIIPGSCQIQ